VKYLDGLLVQYGKAPIRLPPTNPPREVQIWAFRYHVSAPEINQRGMLVIVMTYFNRGTSSFASLVLSLVVTRRDNRSGINIHKQTDPDIRNTGFRPVKKSRKAPLHSSMAQNGKGVKFDPPKILLLHRRTLCLRCRVLSGLVLYLCMYKNFSPISRNGCEYYVPRRISHFG
jgi:hypothetical protein